MLAGSTGHCAVWGVGERHSGLLLHRSSLSRCCSCSRTRLRRRRLFVASASGNAGGSGRKADGSAAGGGLDPALERAVPPDQRPVNELRALRQTTLYSWATLETPAYFKRLGFTWLAFFSIIGGPIAYQTFDPAAQPIEFVVSASIGALLVVAVAVLRIYLGWAYVGDRLLSAAVEYEETGWYDGQVFVKPPQILARDRLLGRYEVQPVLQRLKTTLTGSGAALLMSAVLLFGLIRAGTDADGMYGRGAVTPRSRSANGIVYSAAVRDLSDLRDDDEAAAAEQAAQRGRPGYCGSMCDPESAEETAAEDEAQFCEPCFRLPS